MGHDRELDEHTVPLEALEATADDPLIGSAVAGLLRAQIEGGASSGELRTEWRRVGPTKTSHKKTGQDKIGGERR